MSRSTTAPTLLWPKPLQLVRCDEQTNNLVPVDEVCELVSQIIKPVKVPSVVGECRTGKSSLLNALAEVCCEEGFAVGHEVTGQTRGIWVWAMQEADSPDAVTLLLDTEGLFDTEKDCEYDQKVMVLTILLSSFLILNVWRNLNTNTLNHLNFVASLTEHVRIKQGQQVETSSDFAKDFFPPLLVLIRDAELRLGNSSEAEYLERSLRRSGQVKESFLWRQLLCLPSPTSALFPEQMDRVRRPIANSPIKNVLGDVVTGVSFAQLVRTFVEALNTPGTIPVIENGWKLAAQLTNQKAHEQGVEVYNALLDESLPNMPMPHEALLQIHKPAFEAAVARFSTISIENADNTQELRIAFSMALIQVNKQQDVIGGRLHHYHQENQARARARCLEMLNQLYSRHLGDRGTLLNRFVRNYPAFCQGLDQVRSSYDTMARNETLRPVAAAVLASFMREREGEHAMLGLAAQESDRANRELVLAQQKAERDSQALAAQTQLRQQLQQAQQNQQAVQANLQAQVRDATAKLQKITQEFEQSQRTLRQETEAANERARAQQNEIARLQGRLQSVPTTTSGPDCVIL